MLLNTAPEPPQTEPTLGRPFRIADAMILIAALFVAMAWDRQELLLRLRTVVPAQWSLSGAILQALWFTFLLFPLLAVGSLTVLYLRLQSPRPPWRRLLQQPGAMACALASLALIPAAILTLVSHVFSGKPLAMAWARAAEDLQPQRFAVVAILIGMAVAVSWIVTKGKGQWKPEASWIDRLGRLIGVGWIVMIPGGALTVVADLIKLQLQLMG